LQELGGEYHRSVEKANENSAKNTAAVPVVMRKYIMGLGKKLDER